MKICLFRLSAIGDATHALTVVRQIQAQAPDAEITWIIGRLEHKLLRNTGGVEFIEFDKSRGIAAVVDLRRTLKGRRFDVLLQMQVSFRANFASSVIRADRRIGYDHARSRDLHGLVINERIAPGHEQHVIDALQSFLVPIGLQPGTPHWDLTLSESDYAYADGLVDDDRLSLCVSPVSSHALRNWSVDGYASTADHAARTHNMQVILVGGPSKFEKEFNAAIEARMQTEVLNTTGKDTLTQLAALLGRCDVLLAPDTGPSHIANAMGTDVIGLHAASNPLRSGPYHSARWCVNQYPLAAKKYLGLEIKDVPWGKKIERPGVMDLISVDQVTAKLDQWVAARGTNPRSQE